MVKIPPISLKHKGRLYVVYPRVELITDCMFNGDCIYEVLCLVVEDSVQQCPVSFFNSLDSRETYLVYSHALENILSQTTTVVSLNTNVDFLDSNYVEILLSEFGGDMLILELAESSPLQSIVKIQARLNEIMKNPKIRIWLDDFGTERANFDLMNVINFDAVKMSKELFWDLYENDKILFKYLVKMVKRKANIMVVEGVDSYDKYIFCKEQQCLMQGYFFNEIKKSAAC